MRRRVIALVGFLCALHAAAAQQPAREDGSWTMPARDLAATRFSPLSQITTANAGGLQLRFSFSTGVLRGHEAAPLVENGTMYIVTPYPNYLYALDLTRPGAPVKWKYEPNPHAFSRPCIRPIWRPRRPGG